MTFLPLYQQTVQHASATASGLLLIPMMLGSTVTSLIAGQVTTRTGRYKVLPIIGGAMHDGRHVPAHATSARTPRGSPPAPTSRCWAIGMGFLMQITSLIVQNSVEPRDMGVASSSRTFFQQIGGSIGVSLFGVIFTRRLTGRDERPAAGRAPAAPAAASWTRPPSTPCPPPSGTPRSSPSATAVDGVFIWAVPAAALVFVLAWLVKEIPLRGRAEPPASRGAGRAGVRQLAAGGPGRSASGPGVPGDIPWANRTSARAAAGGQAALADPGSALAYMPPYGTASRISTVAARPLGRL